MRVKAGGPNGQADAAARKRLPSHVESAVATLLIILFATLAALGLSDGLQMGGVEIVFLSAVLLVALVFGLTFGLTAGVAAFVAYRLMTGAPANVLNLDNADLVRLSLFGVGVALTGLYTDRMRRRAVTARALMMAGRAISTRAASPAVEQFLDWAPHTEQRAEGARTRLELPRILVSAAILVVGAAAALGAYRAIGPSAGLLALVVAVAGVGGAAGARFGFAAGLLAFPLLNTLVAAAGHPIGRSPLEAGICLSAMPIIGLGVGVLADRLSAERAALRAFLAAGRDFSTGGDEASIRQALVEGLAIVRPGALVRVEDETGAAVHLSPGAEEAFAARGQDWRTRPLVADGRELGRVQWVYPGSNRRSDLADEAAAALIDLAASALVRTRLAAEKAEMEFVARTEHVRTILLDAVSHHFRSPLAGILGSVTSILNLAEPHDREMRRQMLLIIKEQANRLNRYVENFLSVARLESGSIDVRLGEIDLEGLIYEVWETFGEAGGARRFLQTEIREERVLADPHLLVQVLGNVLENAIKYSPEGSVVDVRTESHGDEVVLRISDQGPGVPEAARDRVFERFFRSPSVSAPGLGLGLYIAHSLMALMGGGISISGRTDGELGAAVELVLPAARSR